MIVKTMLKMMLPRQLKRICMMALLMLMIPGSARSDTAFERDYLTWVTARDKALRSPDGWLTLAGLFWLHAGDNKFGTAEDNDVRFPKGPAHVGSFHVASDGAVVAAVFPQAGVTLDGKPVTQATWPAGATEAAHKMALGTLSWYPIARDGQIAIRLKDSANPTLMNFQGVHRYSPDARWRCDATFTASSKNVVRRVPTAQGTYADMPLAGTVAFTLDGHPYTLEAYSEEGTDELFIIFGDRTNGHDTYPAGRYLYAPKPDAAGHTVVDFNRAYNPPCAFTPYATCSFPTKQNRLPIDILAGEKRTH
jgi:uncharacterized protein (DUF1684 family)